MPGTHPGPKTTSRHRWMAVAATMVLFLGSLAAFSAGHFVQLHDTSGFGSEEWVLPLGWLGGLLAVGALLLAARDQVAPRLLGVACLALVALMIWQTVTNEGFRFIWTTYELELYLLEIALVLVALVLITPIAARARVIAYVASAVVVACVAFAAGIVFFESVYCGDGSGECDIAPVSGILWAITSLGLMIIAVVVLEARRWRRARRRRSGAAPRATGT